MWVPVLVLPTLLFRPGPPSVSGCYWLWSQPCCCYAVAMGSSSLCNFCPALIFPSGLIQLVHSCQNHVAELPPCKSVLTQKTSRQTSKHVLSRLSLNQSSCNVTYEIRQATTGTNELPTAASEKRMVVARQQEDCHGLAAASSG